MKKATMLTLAPIAAATALAGCASTGSYGYDDGGYGYYDNSYHDRYGRYDWNNPDPRYGGYYADNYYRNDRRYRERRMSDGDRIYRGRDGKYYCRRSDGTTGLIVGGIAGGVLGNVIAPGDSKTLGTVIGCHRRRGRGQWRSTAAARRTTCAAAKRLRRAGLCRSGAPPQFSSVCSSVISQFKNFRDRAIGLGHRRR